MAGVNKVILVGNLGKDPEVKSFETSKVANFPLATSEVRKNRTTGERVTITEWHNVAVWGAQADVAEKYLRKGSQVYIEGKLKTRSWDATDGTKRYITEIISENLTLLGKRSSEDGGGNSSQNKTSDNSSQEETNIDNDLPF